MKIAQNIEHSYVTLDVSGCRVTVTVYQHNKMAASWYLNTRGGQVSYPLQRCTNWIATGTQTLVLCICMYVVLENGVNRCPVLCTRSVQKFCGKENKIRIRI